MYNLLILYLHSKYTIPTERGLTPVPSHPQTARKRTGPHVPTNPYTHTHKLNTYNYVYVSVCT